MKIPIPTNKTYIIHGISLLVSKIINRFRDPLSCSYRNILIVKRDEIGDVVLSLPVPTLLKNEYPQAAITVLCRSYTQELFENHPCVDRVVTATNELEGYYDLIVELRENFPMALYALRHPPLYRVDRSTARLQNRQTGSHPHDFILNLRIIEPLMRHKPLVTAPDLYIDETHRQWALNFLAARGIKNYIMIHPGARRVLRQWPTERYAALIDHLWKTHGWHAVIVGTQEDKVIIRQIVEAVTAPTHLLVGEPLMYLAALAANTELFVGNDSGPMHIAAAVGAPVIGLFGPGSPELFAPVGTRAAFIHHKLPCNPCDQVHCVHPEYTCMQRITVEEVLATAGGVRQ